MNTRGNYFKKKKGKRGSRLKKYRKLRRKPSRLYMNS